MRALIAFVLVAVAAGSSYGQKLFIGQTKPQVRAYWELHVSITYFKDFGEDYFVIMKDEIGTSEFEAKFDKGGKCISQKTKIGYDDISVMQARIKSMGYKYDEASKSYVGGNPKVSWKVQPNGTDYLLVCKRM